MSIEKQTLCLCSSGCRSFVGKGRLLRFKGLLSIEFSSWRLYLTEELQLWVQYTVCDLMRIYWILEQQWNGINLRKDEIKLRTFAKP